MKKSVKKMLEMKITRKAVTIAQGYWEEYLPELVKVRAYDAVIRPLPISKKIKY